MCFSIERLYLDRHFQQVWQIWVDNSRPLEHNLLFFPDPTMWSSLPPEVVSHILSLVLLDNPVAALTLTSVCWQFRGIVNRSPYWPWIHINDFIKSHFKCDLDINHSPSSPYMHTVSVRRLRNTAGKGSGLALKVQEIIQNSTLSAGGRWTSAWLQLKQSTSPCCFIVKDIFWL